VLRGRSADYLGIDSKLLYEARARFDAEGGEITRDDSRIKIENADAVTIYFAAATNFVNYKDVSADQALRVKECFNALGDKKYARVKANAIKDYQSYFNRIKTIHMRKVPMVGSSTKTQTCGGRQHRWMGRRGEHLP